MMFLVSTATLRLLPLLFMPCATTAFSLSMKIATSEMRNRVVVVGSANQDLTSYTPTLPVLGETVMGESFETGCGGKGANQANAAGSLGLGPVTMVCRTGDDVFGETLRKNFRRTGVYVDDATAVLSQQSSGVATVVVDTKSGDNMIIVTPGANYKLTPEDVRKELISMTDPPAIVLVQLEILPEAALEALKVGKELGAITILNPAPAPQGSSLDEFFQYVDIIIPNESELRTLCGEREDDDSCDEEALAKSLFEKGVGKAVVVTLGARGAMIVEKDSSVIVSAPDDLPCKNDPVKDTIGAGDGFCGSLSTYMSAGLGLKNAATLACGFAGMSVRMQGANYPTRDMLPDCLRIPAHDDKAAASKKSLTFVTGNKNKLAEVKKILGEDYSFPFDIVNESVDLPELQGDPLEIAKEKCRLAAEKVKGPCITEDTSLCFNALNGMPGPYIKWFLDSCGHDGLNQMLVGFEDMSAYAQTVVAFTMGGADDEIHVFDGRTDGSIVPPRGSLDFGWDPIFEPREGKGKTYAEMSKDEKNGISHRARSFAKLRTFLIESQSSTLV